MPKIKLTLTIESNLVSKIKGVSRRKGRSISSLTESYFRAISGNPSENSLANALLGCAKGNFSNLTDEAIKEAYLAEKHG